MDNKDTRSIVIFVCGLGVLFGVLLALSLPSYTAQIEAQREAQIELLREHRTIFRSFVDSFDNNGKLPSEMWQQNITIEQDTRRYPTLGGLSNQMVVVNNEIRWLGLSDYGIAYLSSFLRENFQHIRLERMLGLIEGREINIARYI